MHKYVFSALLIVVLSACGGAATTSVEADRISIVPQSTATITVDSSPKTTQTSTLTDPSPETPAVMTEVATASAVSESVLPAASEVTTPVESAPLAAIQTAADMTGRWQLAAVNSENGTTFNLILDMTDDAGTLGGNFYITEDALTSETPDGTIVGTNQADQLSFRVIFNSTTAAGENEYWEIDATFNGDSFAGTYVTIYGDTGSATGTPND